MAEQRYQAVLAVISDGETVTDVAARVRGVAPDGAQLVAKYEAGGHENLGERSHRPRSCPHQMDAAVEVELADAAVSTPFVGTASACLRDFIVP